MRSRLTEMESANTRKLVLHDRNLLGWRGLLRYGFLAALWWWATNLMNAPRDVTLVGLGVFGLLVVTGWIGYPLEPRRLVLYSDRFVIWRTFRRYVVRLDDVENFALMPRHQHGAFWYFRPTWSYTKESGITSKMRFGMDYGDWYCDGVIPGTYSMEPEALVQEMSCRLEAATGRRRKQPSYPPHIVYLLEQHFERERLKAERSARKDDA